MSIVQPTAIYLGIDPGQSGGIAAIVQTVPREGRPIVLGIHTTHLSVSDHDVWDWLWEHSGGERDSVYPYAVLERVSARPAQGVTSMFAFGTSYGLCRMALAAAAIPYEEVSPSTWQRALGIATRGKDESRTQFKGRLRARAQLLFPKQKVTLAVADALLLAEYARRQSGRSREPTNKRGRK